MAIPKIIELIIFVDYDPLHVNFQLSGLVTGSGRTVPTDLRRTASRGRRLTLK